MWIESRVFKEDMGNILASPFIEWEKLQGRRIFVTGATGLIGYTLVSALCYHNKTLADAVTPGNPVTADKLATEGNSVKTGKPVTAENSILIGNKSANEKTIRIAALVRDMGKAYKKFESQLADGAEIEFIQGSVEDLPQIEGSIDYIVHGAAPTASTFLTEKPVETIAAVVAGTQNMLELAREKQVSGMCYLSSMEAYGQVMTRDPLSEENLGNINLMSTRSSYPEGKRMAECMCHAYAQEYGVPVRIARLAQTFGPGVSPEDGRVFAYMARCALRGEDIVLKTDGSSENSYLYTADAVSAILGLLTRGAEGDVYNTANEEIYCSVKEMAEQVARTIGHGDMNVQTCADVNCGMYRPTGYLNLNAARLRNLGWQPGVNLVQMYERMIEGSGFDSEAGWRSR